MNTQINSKSEPFVSVLTPVYNGEEYLGDCIESVLKQQYDNYEYIIINNCSTDRTLEIAQRFAEKDSRIQVHSNTKFVGVIENHNIAFRLISGNSKYCKVVSADDWIFPDCISKMVEVAESDPSVGLVGSYQLRATSIIFERLEFPRMVANGKDACRASFLGGPPLFGKPKVGWFGSPTSLLYRSDLIREKDLFYPNPSVHADTSACLEVLRKTNFGFVNQVLSFVREHDQSMTSAGRRINMMTPLLLNNLLTYGEFYLNQEEFDMCFKRLMDQYYRFLSGRILDFKDKKFWDYHKKQLMDLGHPFKKSLIIKALIKESIRLLLNLERGGRKILGYLKPNYKKT